MNEIMNEIDSMNELNNLGENDEDDDEEPGLVLFFSIFEWSLPWTQLMNVDGIVS